MNIDSKKYVKLIKVEQERISHIFDSENKKSLTNFVLDNNQFINFPGSSSNHHSYRGGLLQHTYEVITMAYRGIRTCGDSNVMTEQDLFFACLYHDFGKIYDYKLDENFNFIEKTKSYSTIRHIHRSAHIWQVQAEKFNYDGDIDDVTHAILSHHCLPEWGSPVSPKTKVAWALHTADNMSAKINFSYKET